MFKRLILCAVASAAPALALAQTPAAGAPPAGPGDMTPMLFFMGAIFILFYLMVMRPQRKEQKKREEEIQKVAKGDKAVTIGGIHGTVEAVNLPKGTVSLTIAPKVTIEVNKTALATITPKGRGGDPKDDKDKKESAES